MLLLWRVRMAAARHDDENPEQARNHGSRGVLDDFPGCYSLSGTYSKQPGSPKGPDTSNHIPVRRCHDEANNSQGDDWRAVTEPHKMKGVKEHEVRFKKNHAESMEDLPGEQGTFFRGVTWKQFDWLMSGLEIDQPKALKMAV